MSSRLDLHEELCKILGSRNVYYNPPESVKMKYPAIVYSLNEYDNKSANSQVYLQWPGYSLTLIDKDPDSPIAQKLSVLRGCTLSRPPYPANGLYHFPFNLKTTGSDATKIFDEYYQKGYDQGIADSDSGKQYTDGYNDGYVEGKNAGYKDGQADGYSSGYDTGKTDGYTLGYDKGKVDGNAEGYSNGYEKGKVDGYNDGYNEGYTVGYNEGYEKGKQDATKEEQEKTVTITENGTTEILPDTDKSLSKVTVDVDVEQGVFPNGEIAITENGVYDVTNYESANVEIQGVSGSSDLFPYMVGSPPFSNADLTEITEDITLHLENVNSIANAFSGTKFGCKKLTIYISDKCTTFFRGIRLGGADDKLEEIKIVGDMSKVTQYGAAFIQRYYLKRILGNFDGSSVVAGGFGEAFSQCAALQEFYPVANTIKTSISFSSSPNLIPESIQSIIDGLADLTGGTAQTLDFHSDIVAKLTDEQVIQIADKNWKVI